MQRMDEMDCDLVETTAHMGARPSHAVWQGRIFSRRGKSREYPDFVESTGYGSGEGLMGWNCRHNFYPYFAGISRRAYTNKELKKLAEHKVIYKGKEYNDYEAGQIQRRMEREIRATKRELTGLDTAGKAASSPELKNGLQADFNAASGQA